MKCSKCQAEWTPGNVSSEMTNCPFCGASLVSMAATEKDQTMSDVMVQIVEHFGEEILAQESKCMAAFKDFAPKMEKEQKILKIAFGEGISDYFLRCPVADRESHLQKARQSMNVLLSDEASLLVVNSFAIALGWNIRDARLKHVREKAVTKENGSAKKNVKAYAAQKWQKSNRRGKKGHWHHQVSDFENDNGKSTLRPMEQQKQQDLMNQGDKLCKQEKIVVDKVGSESKVPLTQQLFEQGNDFKEKDDRQEVKPNVLIEQARNCRKKGKFQDAIEFYQIASQLGRKDVQSEMLEVQEEFVEKYVEEYNAFAQQRLSGAALRKVRKSFRKRFDVRAFSCINEELRRKQPDLRPLFAEKNVFFEGRYWAMPVLNRMYVVVPSMGSYEARIHSDGGMKDVFESNFEQGKKYNVIRVICPALFGTGWKCIKKGKLELSN